MQRFLVMLAAVLVASAAQATTTTKLTVNGMYCVICAQSLEKKLQAMPQTAAVYVNIFHKIVAVQAREGQTVDVDKVLAEIKSAGYVVTKVETVTDTADALRAAAKSIP